MKSLIAALTLILLMCCPIAPGMEPADIGVIESFFCSYRGESADAICSYEIRRRIILSMTGEEVTALAEILGDLSAWDGFSEDNPNMLDGESFRLNIAYVDGVGVTARGSNAFPEGYFKVKSAIRDFFFNLMDQYGIDDYAYD